MPNLKIADVPKHLMTNGNWQNYIWEIVMIGVIVTYFSNFIYGKTKNYRLVSAWYQSHRELLERHFTIVGDDGTSLDPTVAKKQQTGEGSEATNGTIESSEDVVEQGKLIKVRKICSHLKKTFPPYFYFFSLKCIVTRAAI